MLNDYISGLPIDVIIKTEIEDQKAIMPTNIDAADFYKLHAEDIDVNSLTSEKGIYVASSRPRPKYVSAIDMVNRRTNRTK